MAILQNKGKREWELNKGDKMLKPGDSRTMDMKEAKKWKDRYPREFELIQPEEAEKELIISDKVKALIKDTKGIAVKSAAKLFKDSEAYDESLQIALIEEFAAKED